MKYSSTLLAVREMKRSLCFYREILGLAVEADYGENVVLTGGIALQTLESWAAFIGREQGEITLPHLAGELYFEEPDYDRFLALLAARSDIKYVHPPMTHRWGQRVIRIFDPDGHIIEVGEPLDAVGRRFAAEGMDLEAIAHRMDVPLPLVRDWLTHKEPRKEK